MSTRRGWPRAGLTSPLPVGPSPCSLPSISRSLPEERLDESSTSSWGWPSPPPPTSGPRVGLAACASDSCAHHPCSFCPICPPAQPPLLSVRHPSLCPAHPRLQPSSHLSALFILTVSFPHPPSIQQHRSLQAPVHPPVRPPAHLLHLRPLTSSHPPMRLCRPCALPWNFPPASAVCPPTPLSIRPSIIRPAGSLSLAPGRGREQSPNSWLP